MYCPNAECPFYLETGTPAEYRQEFLQCTDCGSALQSAKPTLHRRAEPMEDSVHGPVYVEGNEPDRGRLVTIATYSRPEPAHYARGILESVGLTAFVGDDHVAGIAPPLGLVTGGVKLNVSANEVEQAIGVLEEYHLAETDEAASEEPADAALSGDEADDSAETLFINGVFTLIRWVGYVGLAAIVAMMVFSILRD